MPLFESNENIRTINEKDYSQCANVLQMPGEFKTECEFGGGGGGRGVRRGLGLGANLETS